MATQSTIFYASSFVNVPRFSHSSQEKHSRVIGLVWLNEFSAKDQVWLFEVIRYTVNLTDLSLQYDGYPTSISANVLLLYWSKLRVKEGQEFFNHEGF